MIREWGRKVIELEAQGVADLTTKIDADFSRAVRMIHDCPGRVIVTGLGKSGIIGRKITATLTSTGTPASYLHPTEGLHGDLGMVRRGDVILAISKSGETEELEVLVPVLKAMKLSIIAMTANRASFLGRQADLVLEIGNTEEACSMDLVPTTSTTTTLAMGDALAVALFSMRGFGPSDYRQLHPSGSIGRSLRMVSDLMHTGDEIPIVPLNAGSDQMLLEMTSKRLGATCVVDDQGRLQGMITDGDLRRSLERGFDLGAVIAADLMSEDPKTIDKNALAAVAVNRMEEHEITQLVIVDDEGVPEGIVHLHDLLRAKVV
ncbi:MAG: KpsF/GutQ family sugar-phosphate isomerase [Candidatus Latescibacteria bacterium]|nr:KpsF/GutQ family sugar-phosphate isomerase [Candidatus Latescibacterota bacterium]